VHFVEKPKGKKAGLARDDFGKYIPSSFKLISVKDETPAISNVKIELMFTFDHRKVVKTIDVRTNYLDDNNKPLVSSQAGGYWRIIQNSFSEILYGLLEPYPVNK